VKLFGDMKIVRTMYGLGAASSTFCCMYCKVRKDQLASSLADDTWDLALSDMRSVTDMANEYSRRIDMGAYDKASDRYWHNQVAPPLFNVTLSDSPGEPLHMVLRITDKFEKVHTRFRTELNISDERYDETLRDMKVHKGWMGYDGNDCKKILKQLDKYLSLVNQ